VADEVDLLGPTDRGDVLDLGQQLLAAQDRRVEGRHRGHIHRGAIAAQVFGHTVEVIDRPDAAEPGHAMGQHDRITGLRIGAGLGTGHAQAGHGQGHAPLADGLHLSCLARLVDSGACMEMTQNHPKQTRFDEPSARSRMQQHTITPPA
jgi:hypothetical protein